MKPSEIVPRFDSHMHDQGLAFEAVVVGAAPWLGVQDLHPEWSRHVQAILEDLARRLGHGV